MLREEFINMIARDCVHFKGDRPCQPHLRDGALCHCPAYSPATGKALLIQFSSPVWVIRSTALIQRLKTDNPNLRITYLTCFPELLPASVDEPLPLDAGSVQRLLMDQFDAAYNLDLDRRACAIMNMVHAHVKKGFYLRQGNPLPFDDAEPLYLNTLMPHAHTENAPDIIQGLFQMCGLEYRRELPRLDIPKTAYPWPARTGPVIGLNTADDPDVGVTGTWYHRHWIRLIEMIFHGGMTPLLIGERRTDLFNRWLAAHSPAEYLGPVTFQSPSRRADALLPPSEPPRKPDEDAAEKSTSPHQPNYPANEAPGDRPGQPHITQIPSHQPSGFSPGREGLGPLSQLSVRDFMALLRQCDVVVGRSGMTAELAWTLGREIVILHPGSKCGFISPSGTPTGSSCANYFRSRNSIIEPVGVPIAQASLDDILPDQVFKAVLERLQEGAAQNNTRRPPENPDLASPAIATVRSRVGLARRRPR